MRLEIVFDEKLDPYLYDAFSRYLFKLMKKAIMKLTNKYRKRYLVREDAILNCSLVEWKKKKPKKIDLVYYLRTCIQLVRIEGIYVIRLNPSPRIKYAWSPVQLLIRILEYGTNKIPELPMLRRVFHYYTLNYQKIFTKFIKERYPL